MGHDAIKRLIQIETAHGPLEGALEIPKAATEVVLFAHGSGSSRHSTRNNLVAKVIRDASIGTLLFDLLTEEEDQVYSTRFDIPLLTKRLLLATQWIKENAATKALKIGYFGASTGAAAALCAAAELPGNIAAVVSRGGRPDLAERVLSAVQAPTLLIIGGDDVIVIDLNESAFAALKCQKEMQIIPGATHLFEEPGTIEEVARLATAWFKKYL